MNDFLAAAYPLLLTFVVGFVGYAARELSRFLEERNKTSRAARVSAVIATVADDFSRELLTRAPMTRSQLAVLQEQRADSGTVYASERLEGTFAKMSPKDQKLRDETLEQKIYAGMGKVLREMAAAGQLQIADDQAQSGVTLAAEPVAAVSPLSKPSDPIDLPYGPKAEAS